MYFQIENSNVRLGGTMHLVPAGKPLADWVTRAYHWSKTLYLEHDVIATLPLLNLPGGETMEARLAPGVWTRLKAAWPPNGPPLANQKPLAIGARIALAGLSLAIGVEPTVTAQAQEDSRSLRYLETPTEFVAHIDNVSDAVWCEGLEWLLRNRNLPAQDFPQIYDAWIAGDVDLVSRRMLRTGLTHLEPVRRAIFDLRNALWLPRVLALLSTREPTLILVGAGHLGGVSGLRALLQGAGHETLPVTV
jgi:uncharacterized protein YbaP (TraB family)